MSRPVLKPNNLKQRMAVTQELAGVGEKMFLQWYFQHKNIHGVNLQLNRTNFKSLSTLSLIYIITALRMDQNMVTELKYIRAPNS